MTNKEAIKLLQQIEEDGWNVMNFHVEALAIAIKALEEKVNDPRNDPHYAECKYCKYLELSSNDYPCCECKYRSKWEAIE